MSTMSIQGTNSRDYVLSCNSKQSTATKLRIGFIITYYGIIKQKTEYFVKSLKISYYLTIIFFR